MHLLVVNVDEDNSVLPHQLPCNLQPIFHEGQPTGMIEVVVVTKAVTACVVGWVNINQLDLPTKLLLERV